MSKILPKRVGFFILLCAISSFCLANPQTTLEIKTITLSKQQLTIQVELADDRAKWEKGLMFRTELAENHGMLFVFANEGKRQVWMKNTLLPLDILFLDNQGRVVSFLENVQPCRADPCTIYDSVLPARYMLEINAHLIKKHQIKPGDVWRLP